MKPRPVRGLQHPSRMDLAFHRALTAFNHERLRPGLPADDWRRSIDADREMLIREGELVEDERKPWRQRAAAAPGDPAAFVRWFEALRDNGPGQGDALFPWLAAKASLQEVRWFLRQEVAGEAGFDDLVAMTQLKMPQRAKLELARNYWDEMGRGHAHGMHGPMLATLADALELESGMSEPIVCEALALGNLMIALAMNRRYAYQSIGALGVIELTAPGRSALVNEALARLRIPARTRQYFALHATLDVKHSLAWNEEVIAPLVSMDPHAAPAIAEGALMRLEAGRRCFERYRDELGLTRDKAAAA